MDKERGEGREKRRGGETRELRIAREKEETHMKRSRGENTGFAAFVGSQEQRTREKGISPNYR